MEIQHELIHFVLVNSSFKHKAAADKFCRICFRITSTKKQKLRLEMFIIGYMSYVVIIYMFYFVKRIFFHLFFHNSSIDE
jgi:hypothetical protein